jgi:hypothetical protein
MNTLISTYLCTYLSNTTILSGPGVFLICTFPRILVQTWCKSVNMRINGTIGSARPQACADQAREGAGGEVVQRCIALT